MTLLPFSGPFSSPPYPLGPCWPCQPLFSLWFLVLSHMC
jgi:hypothetical protein